jgi:hypothetical protein
VRQAEPDHREIPPGGLGLPSGGTRQTPSQARKAERIKKRKDWRKARYTNVRSGVAETRRKNTKQLYPWFAGSGVFLAAVVLHGVFVVTESLLVPTTPLVIATAAGLLTVRVKRKRLAALVLWATVSMFLAPAWVVLVVFLGWSLPLVALGYCLTFGCGLRWWRHVRHAYPELEPEMPLPLDTDDTGALAAKIMADWSERVVERIIPGSSLIPGEYTDELLSWTAQLPAGWTLPDAQAKTAAVASALRRDVRQVIFDQVPNDTGEFADSSRVRFQLVRKSPITSVVRFTEPIVRSGSVGIGVYADGRGHPEWTVLRENGATSGICIGSNGAGKSIFITQLLVSIRSAWPTVSLYFDAKQMSSKALQEAVSVFSPGLDDAESFTAAAEALVEHLKTQGLRHGWDGFTPGDYHSEDTGEEIYRPLYLFIIDECDQLFQLPGMARRWGYIAKTGRAIGVALVLATQIDRQDAFGGSEQLRSNSSKNVLMFRMDGGQSNGKMIAPELPPSSTLPATPGYAYLRSATSRPTPLRTTFLPSARENPDGVNAEAMLAAHPDAQMCPIGHKAFAEFYTANPEERKVLTREEAARKLDAFLSGQASEPQDPEGLSQAPRPTSGGGASLSEAQGQVLSAIAGGSDRSGDIAVELDVSDRWVRTVLTSLLGKKLVEATGETKNRRYHLTEKGRKQC